MKYLVISDIHGSALSLQTAIENCGKDADYFILCGDYLNHGPRNPLPDGWDPKKTAEILNSVKEKIICVRGNCDAEVDEMVLEFPCLNAYTNILDDGKRIFVHHGHLYDRTKLNSWLKKGSLVISGHTHVTVIEEDNGIIYFNPGSISLPKCEDGKTCGVVEINDGKISISLCSIEGKVIRQMVF